MPYNVGMAPVHRPRVGVGDHRPLAIRWDEALSEARQKISQKDPAYATVNQLMMTEGNLDFMRDAIAKSQKDYWDAQLAMRSPEHDALISEMYVMCKRYHDAWLQTCEVQRALVPKKHNPFHRILRSLAPGWDDMPAKLIERDLRTAYPDYPSAKRAAEKLLELVLVLESRLSALQTVLHFQNKDPVEQHRDLILALGERVESLEEQLRALRNPQTKRKV